MLLIGPAGHWGVTRKNIQVFQNCIFRIEINRKCSNKQYQCLVSTKWVIKTINRKIAIIITCKFDRIMLKEIFAVHRNFHFLFWSLLFGLFVGHQQMARLSSKWEQTWPDNDDLQCHFLTFSNHWRSWPWYAWST